MRHRSTLLAAAALTLASACFGGSSPSANGTPTPVPTATPFATIPAPIIVTPGPASAPVAAATPAPSPAGASGTAEQSYIVAPGDSISVLADRFDVPSAAIRALNNLNGDNITVGQQLRIPVRPGTPAAPTPAPGAAAPTPSTAGLTTYTVTPGDSALGIALKFDTNVTALERANGLPAGGLDRIQIGQVLKLPPPGQR